MPVADDLSARTGIWEAYKRGLPEAALSSSLVWPLTHASQTWTNKAPAEISRAAASVFRRRRISAGTISCRDTFLSPGEGGRPGRFFGAGGAPEGPLGVRRLSPRSCAVGGSPMPPEGARFPMSGFIFSILSWSGGINEGVRYGVREFHRRLIEPLKRLSGGGGDGLGRGASGIQGHFVASHMRQLAPQDLDA